MNECCLYLHQRSISNAQITMGLQKSLQDFFQKQPPEIYKKAVLKNFAIFTEKHLFRRLFLTMLQVCRSQSLLKSLHVDKCITVDTVWFRYATTTFEYHISKNTI